MHCRKRPVMNKQPSIPFVFPNCRRIPVRDHLLYYPITILNRGVILPTNLSRRILIALLIGWHIGPHPRFDGFLRSHSSNARPCALIMQQEPVFYT